MALAAATGLTATTTVMLLVSIVILLRYRQHDLIKYRNVETLIPFLSYLYAVMLLHTISLFVGKPVFCIPLNVLMATVFYFTAHFMMLGPTVVFRSQLNELKTNGDNHSHNHFYWRFARAFVAVPLRLIITVILGSAYLAYYLPLLYLGHLNGDCLRQVIMSGSTYTIIFSGFLGYLSLKLMSVKDVFFLRFEITLSMLLNTPVQVVLDNVYTFAPHLFPDWFDIRWVFIIFGFVIILVNGVFPCCLLNERFHRLMTRLVYGNVIDSDESEKIIQRLQKVSGDEVIKYIFDIPPLLESFKQYAQDNWSVENVLFYQEIETFHSEFNIIMKQPANRVQNIYDVYIRNGAQLEVNLTSPIKQAIKEAVAAGQFSLGMFDEAQRQVKKLMTDDTLKEWRKTASCHAAFVAVFKSDSSNVLGSSADDKKRRSIIESINHADIYNHNNIRSQTDSQVVLELATFSVVDVAGENSRYKVNNDDNV